MMPSEDEVILKKYITELELANDRITGLEEENKHLHNTVAYLTHQLFGRKSEKTSTLFPGSQPSLFESEAAVFNEAEAVSKPGYAEPEIAPEADKKQNKRQKGQRKALLKDVPHIKKVCRIPEQDRICQVCNGEMVPIGEEFIRSELEFIPATVHVIDYYRETLECRTCRKNDVPHIEKASIPAPAILHSFASPSMIAWVMHQKFVNAVPLYRQENEWQMLGVALSRAIMANWMIVSVRDWFMPMIDLLHQKLLLEPSLHADETKVRVMQEEGRKNTTDSYMWLYANGVYAKHAIRLFVYQPGRSGSYPKEFLKGFKGYLHTDCYDGYNKVPDVTHCFCWAHLRRKFTDILPKDIGQREETPASKGIAFCNKLFEIENKLQPLSCEKRKSERLKLEIPVLDAFWLWVGVIKAQHPPKSAIAKALDYALSHKKGLMNYLKDGNCSISNNCAENSIRPFTIGRKNWLFSGSPRGAAASAAIYSLVETAKANGLNPHHYLLSLLEILPEQPFRQHPKLLEDYLPWNPMVQERCK